MPRFENAEEAERFWKAQKDHVEALADLRWFVGDESRQVREQLAVAREEIRAVDRRVMFLEGVASEAAKAAGHDAGSASGRTSGRWSAFVAFVVLWLLQSDLAYALGHTPPTLPFPH